MAGVGTPGPSSHTTVHKSLVSPPTKYDGKKNDYDNFLRQLRLYVLGNSKVLADDESKIITALSFMEGGYATTWANAFTDLALEKSPADWGTWKEFLEKLEFQFGNSTKTVDAMTEIKNLFQKGMTSEEYFIRLKAIMLRGKLNSVMDWKFLLRIIAMRLNRSLVRQIYTAEKIPTNFAEWEEKANTYDRTWRKCNAILKAHGQKNTDKKKPDR